MCRLSHVIFEFPPGFYLRANVYPETLAELGLQEGQLVDPETYDRCVNSTIKLIAEKYRAAQELDETKRLIADCVPKDFQ